jgi:hypothetical protein
MFRSVYGLDVNELEITEACNLLSELPLCITINGDVNTLDYVHKQLKPIFNHIESIKRDSTPESRKMKEAIQKLKKETGKDKFNFEEVNAQLGKG